MKGRTPYNDSYPSCVETRASLLVYPKTVSNDDVTSILGIAPTTSQTAGSSTTNSLGRTRIAKLDLWQLSSETAVASKDLRRHLDWLMERLMPRAAALRALGQRDSELVAVVACVWVSRGGHQGPVLSPLQMRQLAELELDCELDVYFDDALVVSESEKKP